MLYEVLAVFCVCVCVSFLFIHEVSSSFILIHCSVFLTIRKEQIKQNMAAMPALIEEFRKERKAARLAKKPPQRAIPLVPEVYYVRVCVYEYMDISYMDIKVMDIYIYVCVCGLSVFFCNRIVYSTAFRL